MQRSYIWIKSRGDTWPYFLDCVTLPSQNEKKFSTFESVSETGKVILNLEVSRKSSTMVTIGVQRKVDYFGVRKVFSLCFLFRCSNG